MTEPCRSLAARLVSRRGVLRGAIVGSVALGAAVGPRWLSGRGFTSARQVKTISAEIEQTEAAFGRGDRRGTVVEDRRGERVLAPDRVGGEQVFISEAVAFDFPTTHVGLHWDARSSGGWLDVSLSSSFDGVTWTDWTTPPIDAAAGEAPRPDTFAALVATNGARFARYRVRFDTTGGSIAVRRVSLTALNSVDGEQVAVRVPISTGVDAAVPKPSILSRAAWGAYEGYRYSGSTELWPREYVSWRKVVFHHTATSNGYADAAAQVRSIYYYHAVTQGWGDIGYNALIGNNGQIYEGRKGRDGEVVSLDTVAGHVYRCNYGTMGISMIGDFSVTAISSGMLDAGARIAAWACSNRGIAPLGSGVYARSDGTTINTFNIPGHREIASPSFPTSCPGNTGASQLPNFRQRVATIVAAYPNTATPTRTPTRVATLAATATATATRTPSATATKTPTRLPTATRTPTKPATATATRTPTKPPTVTGTATPPPPPTQTAVPPTATALPAPFRIAGSGRTAKSTTAVAVYDRNLGTVWQTLAAANPPASAYIFVDLGLAQPIRRVRWVFGLEGMAPEYRVQVSSDRVTWTNLTAQPLGGGAAGVWQDLAVAVSARYVRWMFTNPTGVAGLGGLAEVELWP